MISPVAITLALAFWTPTVGHNPCPDGVNVQPLSAELDAPNADGGASWFRVADTGAVVGSCTIRIGAIADSYSVPKQCALVAHELGHALFGLDHAEGIMWPYSDTRPIPAKCYSAPVKGQLGQFTFTKKRYSVRRHVRKK